MSPQSTYNDSELIHSMAEGDAMAFEIIYNRHFNAVFFFVKRFVADASVAEDVTRHLQIKTFLN